MEQCFYTRTSQRTGMGSSFRSIDLTTGSIKFENILINLYTHKYVPVFIMPTYNIMSIYQWIRFSSIHSGQWVDSFLPQLINFFSQSKLLGQRSSQTSGRFTRSNGWTRSTLGLTITTNWEKWDRIMVWFPIQPIEPAGLAPVWNHCYEARQ